MRLAAPPPKAPTGAAIGLAGLLAGCWLLAAGTPSVAHSWYPRVCCNDLDCTPVDRIDRLVDGSMQLTVGHFTVLVPPGFPVMPSQDEKAHVCVYRNMAGHYLPRCLFLPGIS